MARKHSIIPTGTTFGGLTFLRDAPLRPNKQRRAFFACHCGKEFETWVHTVKSGRAKSCGCSYKHPKRNIKCGLGSQDNKVMRRLWRTMLRRCNNPKSRDYKNYGARGIKVCEAWSCYETFIRDVGVMPTPDHSLDRLENGGNYEPGNVRWATRCEQSNNKRNNRFIEFSGERLTLPQWERKLCMGKKTIASRLKAGWSIERALTTPPRKRASTVAPL